MPSDGSHHTAEGSSRKRLKISRDASRPAGMSQMPEAIRAMSPAKREAPSAVENDLHTDGTPCHHEQSLRGMNDKLDEMRQLITCKICQRFLYEPYGLTCGHTFCYSCLSQWLGQNRKKTCPDCRTIIKDQPSPSYLIREMVLVFVSKSEMLPDGETSEEHHQYAKEEAEIVAKDKANTDLRTGGLFKGSFRRGGSLMPLIAIRDHSDNVDRRPQCTNEVEDGRCNTCNVRVRGEDDDLDWSDEDSEDSDLDHDLDDDDHFPLPFDDLNEDYPGMYDPDDFDEDLDDFDYGYELPPGLVERDGPVSDVSDEDDDEDENDPDMDGFIDDGPHHLLVSESSDINGDSDGTEVVGSRSNRRGRAAIVVSDDDDDVEDDDEDDHPLIAPRRRVLAVRMPSSSRASEEPSSAGAGHSVVSDDDDDDDDDEPVTASQRSRGGRRHPINLIDESNDEDSDNETETTTRSAYGGFSPPQYDLTGESEGEDHENEHDYHDHYADRSSVSGPTEQSMDHYDDYDRESDGSDADDDGYSS